MYPLSTIFEAEKSYLSVPSIFRISPRCLPIDRVSSTIVGILYCTRKELLHFSGYGRFTRITRQRTWGWANHGTRNQLSQVWGRLRGTDIKKTRFVTPRVELTPLDGEEVNGQHKIVVFTIRYCKTFLVENFSNDEKDEFTTFKVYPKAYDSSATGQEELWRNLFVKFQD